MAYSTVEPFGEYAEWLRAGIIAAVIANVNRNTKTSKVYTPEDFMPEACTIQRKTQTLEEQQQALQSIYSFAKKRGLTKDVTHV